MYRRLTVNSLVVATLFALTLVAPLSLVSRAAPNSTDLERVIIVLHGDAGAPQDFAASVHDKYDGRTRFIYQRALKGFAAELTPAAIDALRHDPRVAFVEPDFKVQATDQQLPTGITRIEADKNPATGIGGAATFVNANIVVLDTGIGPNSDLNIAGGANCVSNSTSTSATCVSGNYSDDNGHGTHVAGIAAAINNGIGVVGVAPGARLWAVKVLDSSGSGYISSIVAGIDWAINQGNIDVLNMSLDCKCSSVALTDAINNATAAGIVPVAAAGNSSSDAGSYSPASISGVIAVSAMTDYNGQPGGGASPTCSNFGADDSFASFSNFGTNVAFAAPGVCILSTLPGNTLGYMSGTSMASPYVAGAAALYIASHGVAGSSSRWSTVLNGMRASWSVAQSSSCGFTGGRSAEPMLLLASCTVGSTSPSPSPTPTPTPSPTPSPSPTPTAGTVTGLVMDALTGQRIAGATVAVGGTGQSTVTAFDGSYTLSGVPAGSQTMSASAIGYLTQSKLITVTGGATNSVTFALMPSTSGYRRSPGSNPGPVPGPTPTPAPGPGPAPAPTAGIVAGTVTDFSGHGIGGALVTVTGTGISTLTNSAGQYQLAGLKAGSYTVTVYARGYPSQSRIISVQGGQTTIANFQLG